MYNMFGEKEYTNDDHNEYLLSDETWALSQLWGHIPLTNCIIVTQLAHIEKIKNIQDSLNIDVVSDIIYVLVGICDPRLWAVRESFRGKN